MEGWHNKRLGDVLAVLKNGLNCKQDKSGQGQRISRIESISQAFFDIGRVGYAEISDQDRRKFKLSKGDILFSHINSPIHVGKTAVFDLDEEVYHGVNLLLMRPTPVVSADYLEWYLKYLFERGYWLSVCKQSVNQASVNQQDISRVPIAYPTSCAEQRRIVAILDEAFEAIATAEANTEKNLQNAREVFESHVEHVLSQRQSHWLDCKLGDLCQVKTGKKDVNQGNPEGEFPFFTCAAQHTYSDSFSFDAEALLIAGNGNVGQVTYYTGKFEAYQRTYVLSSFKSVDARYLFRVLDKRLSAKVSKQKLGNTMPYIKVGMLTDFVVPVPSPAEQRRITEELESIAGETERLESLYVAKSKALIELKKSLLQQAFTGQLTAKHTDQQLEAVT